MIVRFTIETNWFYIDISNRFMTSLDIYGLCSCILTVIIFFDNDSDSRRSLDFQSLKLDGDKHLECVRLS